MTQLVAVVFQIHTELANWHCEVLWLCLQNWMVDFKTQLLLRVVLHATALLLENKRWMGIALCLQRVHDTVLQKLGWFECSINRESDVRDECTIYSWTACQDYNWPYIPDYQATATICLLNFQRCLISGLLTPHIHSCATLQMSQMWTEAAWTRSTTSLWMTLFRLLLFGRIP